MTQTEMHRIPMYLTLSVLTLCMLFGANTLISCHFMKNDEKDLVAPRVPKWKVLVGFWCWVLYQLAYPFLYDGHPWKFRRIGLTAFVRYGTRLFFQFGVMFWYSLFQIAAIFWLLRTIK